MEVRVLLFGAEARAAGCVAVEVGIGQGACVDDLRAALGQQHPLLAGFLAHARVARNHAFARGEDRIEAGDELALIGLVSGG